MGAPKPWPTAWPEPLREDEEEDPDSRRDPGYLDDERFNDLPVVPLPEDSCTGLPSAVTWGVTHPCNLRCAHCYDALEVPRTDLNTADAESVIDRLAELGVTFIAFSGGEPLLRKDLYQLLRHCAARKIEFSLRSNATRITPDVAHALASLGTTVVGVSLDGATAGTHDQMRGVGAYARTVRGIHALVEAGVRVNVEYVLSRRNAHESEEAILLGEELGASEVNFSAIQPQGRARNLKDDMLDHGLWRELTQRLYNASKGAAIAVGPSCALLGSCVAGVEPNVTCDGWVTACYLSSEKLFHLLHTPIDQVRRRLMDARLSHQDACGRREFMAPSSGRSALRVIPLIRRDGSHVVGGGPIQAE